MMKRRTALKLLAGAPCTLAAPAWTAGLASGNPAEKQTSHLQLGVVTYSVRSFTREEVIAALKQLEVSSASPYRLHLPIEVGTADECRVIANGFREVGIRFASTGVVELRNNESSMRRAFENAAAAGLTMMTIKPRPDCLPLLEKFVKEFNIKVAIHNHGPEDKFYPNPEATWKIVQEYDPRIGICIDFGHAARAGADPIAAIHACKERLYDFHLKDSIAEVGARKDVPVEIGRGRLNIWAALSALREINYQHQVGVEFDRQDVNLLAGLAECLGYVRGTLDAIERSESSDA